MGIENIEHADYIEVLPPEQTEEEREEILRKALVDSARGLSVDERYVLSQLSSAVAGDATAGISLAGCLATLPVAVFAASAGLTFKVARRRLDHATKTLFGRTVSAQFSGGGVSFCWVDSRHATDDSFALNFSGPFLKYLRSVGVDASASRSSHAFANALSAPVAVPRGLRIPLGLAVVYVSRRKAHVGRPHGMTKAQLNKRLERRLKRALGIDGMWDAIDAVSAKGPLRSRQANARYTHREIDFLYNWVIENKDKPNLTDF